MLEGLTPQEDGTFGCRTTLAKPRSPSRTKTSSADHSPVSPVKESTTFKKLAEKQRHKSVTADHASLTMTLDEISCSGPGSGVPLRHLSLFQLIVLNSVVCGLEFCASAAFTYIPPMLLKSGIEEAHMSIVLGVGPLLGFFLVPIIGRMSDSCTSPYGRRRPFILGLGIMLIFSLLIIPYGEYFSRYAFGTTDKSKTFGVVLLIGGAVLLDFTSQACLTPCEALLSDACRNTNQQEKCFTMYSFMVSLGGCIGYLITALDWTSSRVGLYFGGQEQCAFAVLIVLFTLTLCATLGVAEETPLKPSPPLSAENESLILNNEIHQALLQQKDSGTLTAVLMGANDAGYETGSNQSLSDDYLPLVASKPAITPVPRGGDSAVCAKCFNCPQFNLPCTKWSFTSFGGLSHLICLKIQSLLPETIRSLFKVPFVLKRLALANYCSWTAIMAFNLFFTDYMGQAVYKGNPHSSDVNLRNLYDEGVRMGSWGLLCHCIVAAIYAGFVERLVIRYGMRTMYLVGMMSFTLAIGIMMISRNIYFVNFMAACTGFGYATITTIPFMLITAYHEHKELFFYDVRTPGGLPIQRGMASDLATVDSAYFLSQVLLASGMGYLVDFTGTVLTYIVCACGVGVISCVCIMRIIHSKQLMSSYIRSNKIEPTLSEA